MVKNIEARSTSKGDAKEEIKQGVADRERDKQETAEREAWEWAEAQKKKLQSCDKFYEQYDHKIIDDIYEWYAKAMVRREDRKPLSKESFIGHFFEGGSAEPCYMYGDTDRGFLLGVMDEGVFVGTHFAPKTIRRGVELMRDLGNNGEVPALLAITEDLAKTLKKMPEWKVEDFEIPASFMGQEVKKKIAHNRNPKIQEYMEKKAAEYLAGHN